MQPTPFWSAFFSLPVEGPYQAITITVKRIRMSHSELSIAHGLDNLPLGRYHYRILALIGAGLFLDSFELQMAGAVLGAVLADHWSTTQLNAWFISATFLGFLIGAWTSGILGDRLGRRYCYQINLGIFGLTSLLAAFAPNMYVLIGLHFLMGIGLGGELVLGYATLSEFMPPPEEGDWSPFSRLPPNAPCLWQVYVPCGSYQALGGAGCSVLQAQPPLQSGLSENPCPSRRAGLPRKDALKKRMRLSK